ncbi:TonB-dependent siderophore receptor [Halopseudomonas pelagia]|uniref:TonB-dependent siderophore receptor n=1 Tax=Halopseudomonas pelagia TaxID=553151 RepID=UPI0030DA7042|tara:strand:- start:914 stop:3136 length:2223 start_codon:yes stop_codon:yes gene_type:complete
MPPSLYSPRVALLPLCLAIAVATPCSATAEEGQLNQSDLDKSIQDRDGTASRDTTDDEALVLDTMVVTGAANAEVAGGPVQGYRAKRSATGTRTDTALMQTPVSVQVVSRELMDDQQALSMNDALKNVSGVYVMQGPDGNTMDAFNIRGFQLDSHGATYLDGVKDFSRAPKETAGLERVEVLKGPAAIMYGRIEPGGMINRVSKQPQLGQFTRLQQQVGSDSLLRTTLDSNGALNDDQSWLYRVNLAVENADGYKDHTDNQRTYLAPQVSWQISDMSRVRAGLEYQTNERSWASTYGTIGDANGPVDVPISTNLHDKDDYYEDDSLTWHLSWEHAFNDAWRLQQRLTYVDRSSKAEGSSLSAADQDGNYTRTYWGWEDEQASIASTNIDLIGDFATGSIEHTLLLGVDYFDEEYDSGGWASGGTPQPSNIYAPNNDDAPYDQDHSVTDYWYDNRNLGAYLQNQMALLDDRLHLLLGARYDSADYTYHYGGTSFNPKDSELTWRGGVLYQLTPAVAVYASYVEGFGKSNFSWGSEEIFDPQTSQQYEVGTKLQLTPDLSLTLAAFELVKDNLTMADPNDITRTILAGEATSKGLEMDLAGQLTDRWKVMAAYAYTDVRYTRSDQFQGERLHSIPRHGASLWNTYAFGASGWEVGAGLTYRSERLGVQRGNQPSLYPYTMDAYTLVDLMIGYEFPLQNMTAKAQLNVNNLTDEVYHPATYGRNSRIAQGQPRQVLASLNVTF